MLVAILIYLFLILVYLICAVFPFLLYVLKTGFGFCSLLCSVECSGILPGKFIIKTLALGLIWYLGCVLRLLLYFGCHLMESINNYTLSSKRVFL